jgi:hypothetical protein
MVVNLLTGKEPDIEDIIKLGGTTGASGWNPVGVTALWMAALLTKYGINNRIVTGNWWMKPRFGNRPRKRRASRWWRLALPSPKVRQGITG